MPLEKIDRVMAKFRVAMLKKFHKKESEGYTGWDKQPSWNDLVSGLFEHVGEKQFDEDNLIDIALYCLFLWNLEKEMD